MDQDNKALVFLVGAKDMRRIFRDWPKRMQLAVCLTSDGDCQMVVHREEEGRRFLTRLQRLLAVPLEDVCFFPEIEGYASRRLLYSEEKQLFALIQNAPEIVEEARDYTINYSYAQEEGMDPLSFVSPAQSDLTAEVDAPAPQVETAPQPEEKPVPTSRTSRPPQRLHLQLPKSEEADQVPQSVPRFMQRQADPVAGHGFQSLADLQALNPAPDTAFVHPEANGWVAVDLLGCVGGQVTINNPGNIFLRDDHRMMALRNDMVGQKTALLPERIRIGVKFLPAGVREMLRRNTGEVAVSFENGLFFLAMEQSAHVVTVQDRPQAGQSWRLWASAAAILAVAGIGLQSALFPQRAAESDGPIDWSEFQSGAVSEDAPPEISSRRG